LRGPAAANPAALGVFLWSEVLHLCARFLFCHSSRLFFLSHTIPLCFGLVVGVGCAEESTTAGWHCARIVSRSSLPLDHIRARSRGTVKASPAALGIFLRSEVLHLCAFLFCRWSRLFFLRHIIPLCFGLVVGWRWRRRIIDDRRGRSVWESGHPGGSTLLLTLLLSMFGISSLRTFLVV
jgi:hypothetical protein